MTTALQKNRIYALGLLEINWVTMVLVPPTEKILLEK